MRKCLLILGMHRSGTSAMGGALNCAGVSMGQELLGAADDNKKGYFESKAIQAFHDRQLLPRLGRDWKSVAPLPGQGWEEDETLGDLIDEAKKIIQDEFGDSLLFGIKDPRISLLVPFWLRVLGELEISVRVVIQYRHPVEVAGSLLSRNKTTIEQGVALWVEHVIHAERFTRGIPRVFTHYQDLLDDPIATLEKISRELEIEWPGSAEDLAEKLQVFLEGSLRHQVSAGDQSFKELPEIVSRIYSAHLLAVSKGCNDASTLRAFDELNSAYEGLHRFFASATLLNGLRESELFYGDGEGFSQSRRGRGYFSIDSSATVNLEFDLPSDGLIDVRFDPCSESVILELHDVDIVYEGGGRLSIKKYIKTNATYRYGDIYFFAGTDPQIKFKGLEPGFLEKACKVQVSFDVLQNGERSERIISPVQHLFSEVRRLNKVIDEERAGYERLKVEMELQSTSKASAERELSPLSREMAVLEGRIELYKTKLNSADERISSEKAAVQLMQELILEKDRSLQLAIDLAKELELAVAEARAAAAARGDEVEQIRTSSQHELAAAHHRIAQAVEALRQSTENNEQQRAENLRLSSQVEVAQDAHRQAVEASHQLMDANAVQQQEILRLNQSLLGLSTKLKAEHDANARHQQAYAALRDESKSIKELLSESRRESEGRALEIMECKSELESLKNRVDKSEREMSEASFEMMRTRALLTETTELANKLRSRLARVGLSRSWRYTRILRKVLGKRG
ncbi:hypothetical protein [Pseudomonas sp. Q1-7]|uniref:hypothetical protein n=1 Tax=Pseudomonas sp. Q1-7 TaxID=3020843 RepID=UPI0023002F8B|nr:hypothetical protein [Pseudomonas sp. Q1-7]